MLHHVLNIISSIYRYPFVNKVVKKSMMGNHHDKTMDYYRSLPIISLLDEEFHVSYRIHSVEYIINCTSDTYNHAFSYIKDSGISGFGKPTKTILSAYEHLPGGAVDITNTIFKYFGPEYNFYENTPFHTKASDISTHPIYIVTNDLSVYIFEGDETMSILGDSNVNLTYKQLPV